ncbi:MAG TPA: histidine kinase dimerization/phospho-acceptor domain-containing protein, partial [Aggregatilineales bacterium]|nr:histidine kinase dimerization/phospho-acceptor domain-containing protein [Aggregatilineales bacterium]
MDLPLLANVPNPLSYVLAAILSIGYVALIVIAARERQQIGRLQGWLTATLVLALLAQLIHLVHPLADQGPYGPLFKVFGVTQPAVAVYLTSLVLIAFSGLTLSYLQRRGAGIIAIVGVLWWVGLLIVPVGSRGLVLGQPDWLSAVFSPPLDPSSAVALIGWIVLGLLTLFATFYSFYTAHLPEIANRVLFWIIVIPLVLMGALLGTSGSDILKEIGWISQFVGLVGATYGAIAHRVFDIRRVLRSAVAASVLTAVTALVILAALMIAQAWSVPAAAGLIALVGLAIVAAIVQAPLRNITLAFVNRFFGSFSEDMTGVVRKYSQEVGGVVELDELVRGAMTTLHDTLHVKRGGLLLATRDDNDTIRVEPMPNGLGDMPEIRGWIPKGSPIYHTLFDERSPLLQFDLEFSREHSDVAPELKSFFKQLRMAAYAPIIVQGQLLGILAAGAKTNDDPFYPQNLELLATLANQTGVALRNARLVNDLRRASEEMQNLNKDLVNTKDQLEKLDSVKTDFITIASHELRTPLAQIRGYTDILDALNEQGMLDPDQMSGMTTNLRKATDRLERLIGDMLDVSQLGLDAMDLRFAQTTIESILRLAIEPLTESIKQRKLTLVARGLRGLPPLEADMQRLVQAFRNIVTNAIKYTPDGGRIDILAHLQKN